VKKAEEEQKQKEELERAEAKRLQNLKKGGKVKTKGGGRT